MSQEIVYVLINEAMPGYVKVGRTSDLEQRIRSLDNTSTPLPFECFYACSVNDSNYVERQLHDAFLDHRVRSNREFFMISPDRVVSALKLAEIENVTPRKDYVETQEDQKALNEARSRRSAFNFKMVDIFPGSVLSFVNDETIKTKVVDAKSVEYEGNIYSTSSLAQRLLGLDYPVAGPIYWLYEGETLYDRRMRYEKGEI